MLTLRDGDTVRVSKIRALGDNPAEWSDWTPNKGLVFRVLVLGVEPRRITADAPILDPFVALRELGWRPETEVEELADLRATVDQIRRALRLPEGSTTDEIAAAVERLVETYGGAP